MEFRIADTFTDSLGKLTGEEQKAVKTTAFDLQLNPANPGMKFHKLDRARDKDFWSVRVGRDIRLMVKSDSCWIFWRGTHSLTSSSQARERLDTRRRAPLPPPAAASSRTA